MARRKPYGNQGMHDTKECCAPACRLKDARKWPCCAPADPTKQPHPSYCVVHQQPEFHTHAHTDQKIDFGLAWVWDPKAPRPPLGPFEGMPAKKSLRLRKLAAKKAQKGRSM